MSFDRVARYYRAAEIVLAGSTLQRMRTRHLAAVRECRHILLVGEGHGRGLEAVLVAAPDAAITVVEASAGMIEVARARVNASHASAPRVRWIHEDARTWSTAPAAFDAVITSFFLDCFDAPAVDQIVSKLGTALRPGGRWINTDFCVPASGWRRARARVIQAAMYRTFAVLTRIEARRLTPPDSALRAAGLTLRRRETACAGLVQSDLWERAES